MDGCASLANQWIFDDDDDDSEDNNQQNSQSSVQLPNAARQHMRKIERENAELKKQLEEAKASQRKASVADLVKAKGYDPKIAEMIPQAVEATEESVGKWLDERASLFAKVTQGTDTGNAGSDEGTAGTEGTNMPETVIAPEVAQALAMMGIVTSSAMAPSKPADLMAQLNDPNLTKEKLDALVRSQGGKI